MKLGRQRKTTRNMTPTQLAYLITEGDVFPSGYHSADKDEVVLTCANVIADLVSSMTIMLMANGKDGDIRIKNKLSKRIDIYPCSFMDRKNFIYWIVKNMVLYGNAVVYPDVKGSSINDLRPIATQNISYTRRLNEKESYRIIINGEEYNPQDLLHFVLNPDTRNPYRGNGYSKEISQTIKNLCQANTTKTGFLKSKWKPSMIISIQTDIEELIDSEQRKKILSSYTKDTEAGEPWLIPAGEIDVKTIQPLTLNDLAIQDSITLDKKAVAAAFRVPPFMVGIGDFDKDQYNNFVSTEIMAIASIVQQQLTNKLLISDEMYFRFNPKSLLQYTLPEKASYVKDMVAGGMLNRNEGRNEFDLSPVDKPGMNDYIVLENYIPVEKVGDQKKLEVKK